MKKSLSCLLLLCAFAASAKADIVPAVEWFPAYDMNKDHKLDSMELAFAQIDLAGDMPSVDRKSSMVAAGKIVETLQYLYGDLSKGRRLINENAWNPGLVEQKIKSLRAAQMQEGQTKTAMVVVKKS